MGSGVGVGWGIVGAVGFCGVGWGVGCGGRSVGSGVGVGWGIVSAVGFCEGDGVGWGVGCTVGFIVFFHHFSWRFQFDGFVVVRLDSLGAVTS